MNTWILVIGIALIILTLVYVIIQRIMERRGAYTIEHVSYEYSGEDCGKWEVIMPDKGDHSVEVFRTADGILHRKVR